MKKQFFKANKTKLIARVMLLVLLLASALSFAGCTTTPKYRFIPDYNNDSSITVSVYSDTNVFDIDNVNLTVSYSAHELNIFGQVSNNPKDQIPYIFSSQLSMEICICNNAGHNGIGMGYKVTPCCRTYKTIEEDELFTQKYGHIETPFFISNGIVFKHSETITIPGDFFVENKGKIRIRFFLYDEYSLNHMIDNRVSASETGVSIEYKKIDDNKIELTNYWK